MRVVSLVPSVTETLAAWGVEPVAVTRFCERPDLPAVGGTKDPDLAAVARCHPDLVVLCEEENRREDAEALAALGLALHVLRVDSVEDVPRELLSLARAVGHDGPLLDGELPSPVAPRRRPAVVVPIWRNPWMVLGASCYGASVVRHLGGEPVVLGDDRYPTADLTALVSSGAELVLAPDEPYPFGERHRDELASIAPVRFVDGADLLWWGWRTPAALRRLAAALDLGA